MKRITLTLTPQQAAIVQIATSSFCDVPNTETGRDAARKTAQHVLDQVHRGGADGYRNAYTEALDRYVRYHLRGKREPDSPKGQPRKGNVVPLRTEPDHD